MHKWSIKLGEQWSGTEKGENWNRMWTCLICIRSLNGVLVQIAPLILQRGLSQLAAAFPAYHITGISIEQGLHLKSLMTMAGPGLVAVGTSSSADKAKKLVKERGHFEYKYFELPDDTGANCLYLNGTLVHTSQDWFPESCQRFEQLDTPARKVALTMSELNKVDGCFTCSCVLIK